jgi:hypothetical protein
MSCTIIQRLLIEPVLIGLAAINQVLNPGRTALAFQHLFGPAVVSACCPSVVALALISLPVINQSLGKPEAAKQVLSRPPDSCKATPTSRSSVGQAACCFALFSAVEQPGNARQELGFSLRLFCCDRAVGMQPSLRTGQFLVALPAQWSGRTTSLALERVVV